MFNFNSFKLKRNVTQSQGASLPTKFEKQSKQNDFFFFYSNYIDCLGFDCSKVFCLFKFKQLDD
jgi:hypothetical protein